MQVVGGDRRIRRGTTFSPLARWRWSSPNINLHRQTRSSSSILGAAKSPGRFSNSHVAPRRRAWPVGPRPRPPFCQVSKHIKLNSARADSFRGTHHPMCAVPRQLAVVSS